MPVPKQGLPNGWTQDVNVPANVASNGGYLDLGSGGLNGAAD